MIRDALVVAAKPARVTPRAASRREALLCRGDGDRLPVLRSVRLVHGVGKLQRERVAAAGEGHVGLDLCLAVV